MTIKSCFRRLYDFYYAFKFVKNSLRRVTKRSQENVEISYNNLYKFLRAMCLNSIFTSLYFEWVL